MKQNTFKRQLWMMLLMLLIPLGAWADDVVNQLQFGKQTITVAANQEITFYDFKGEDDIPSSSSSNSQSMTVFTPAEAGMSIQITFTMIDILPDMSSGAYPTFMKVYSGTPDDSNFTWAAAPNEVTKTSTLPDGDVLVTRGGMVADEGYTSNSPETYVSAAADGSMAVGFIYVYAKKCKGWKATVKCVTLEDMTITGAGSNYDGIGGPQTGKTNVPLANAYVTATGTMNPDNVTGIWFKMVKNEDAMNPLALKLFKGNTQLDATVSEEGEFYKFTLNESPVDGTTTFTIKGDFLGTAATGAKVQVDVTKIATVLQPSGVTPFSQGTSVEVENPGIVLMTDGNLGTINLGLGQSLNVYDDGGPDGDGANGVESIVTFAPMGEAQSIRLTDQGLTFNFTSHLYIYEGSEVNEANLLKDLTGSSAKFDPIIVDGPVTLKYVGAGSYYKPNFAILVEGYKKADVTITGVTAEDISVSEVLKGQTDVKMLKIAVEAEGELTPVDITAFNVTVNGDAVAAQHIYQTGTVGSFSPTEEFNAQYTITQTGTYYFWLTLDIDADAAVGETAGVTLTGITTNSETIALAEPVSASVTIASGKSGTYTVGQGGDYATIQGAIDDLGTLGMDGPVVLKIKAGEYNEKVRIPNVRGMGGVNTLTLETESGERDVKIFHNVYFSGGYTEDQNSKVHGVITLYEAQYVTLKNLEVTTTDLGYDAVVMVKNESRHITIDNCYIHAVTTKEYQQDVNLIGHYAQDVENKNNDFLTVKNCLLEGGYIGINMGGTGYVALPKEVGGVIEGNTLKNQGSKSIYVQDELGAKIRNNNIIIEASADTKMSTGIMDVQVREEYSESLEITGNTFNVAPNYYTTALYLRQLEGSATAPVIIANNVVNMTSLSTSYTPFKFSTGKMKYVNVAHNTIRITGQDGGAAFWASSKLDEGYGNINVVNNIIQNETSGYAVNLYNDANLGTAKFNFQNNVMSTSGETFFRAGADTDGDFAAFVTTTGATNCVNKVVSFLSDDVLEPANDLDGDLLTAVALDYVTTDIMGKARPTTNITIGAYEYDATAQSAPVMAEGYPKVLTHLDGNASFSVKTDIAATVYYVVQKSSATAPTAAALVTVETKKDVAANTEATIEVTGLEDEEEYIAYFLPVSLRGIASETVSYTEPFTMDVTPPETAEPVAEVYINNSDTEETVEPGTAVTLMAMVTVDEHAAPYTLTWMDSKHNVLKTETFESADDIDDLFMTTATPTECTDYIFTVEDAAGKSATAIVRAILSGDAIPATFENLYLAENSWENGAHLNGSFVSGSYKFDNGCMPEWSFYYDFMYSNRTATTFANYVTDQFNCAVGSGFNGSENFVVAYPQGGKISVLNNPEGDVIRGFYVTNDAWTVDNIVNGDGMSDDGGAPFGEGDYFKLIITADNGNSVDFYLADYRSTDAAERYYVNTWEWVDLTSLGTVKYLTFTFDGTKKNSYGLTTATYFCLDDFNGTAPTAIRSSLSLGEGRGEAYDLSGRQVKNPRNGIFIINGKKVKM